MIPNVIDFSNDISMVMLKPTTPTDKEFECKNPSYTEYYRVSSFDDIKDKIGQIWLCMYRKKVIGFVSIAMAHMRPERDKRLQRDGYGNIPALLIGHLATHKDYEGKGVGTNLIAWAIKEAVHSSQRIGCRIVMLNPEDDPKIRTYYIHKGFTYVPQNDKERDAFYLDIQTKLTLRPGHISI